MYNGNGQYCYNQTALVIQLLIYMNLQNAKAFLSVSGDTPVDVEVATILPLLKYICMHLQNTKEFLPVGGDVPW